MRRNNVVLAFVLLVFGWFSIAATVQAAPTGDPVSLLQYIANNMIAGLKKNKATLKTKPSIVYNLAYQYVVPYANLNEMSKRVLPPRIWNNATSAQKQEFQKLFTTTVIRTYASALTNYQDQTIKFFPVRGGTGGNTVEVNSQIISSSNQPINVTYRLVRTGGGWRLYDMSVEGVSMLSSFRAQFADILSQGDMNTLLNRLSGHNKR
ncbi:putative phospholipid-binding protein MlaC [Aquicella siphonis]|uniref:Putative phospholipid-binding protein MlaC n=1 Tax=Aquicella siphonis TaxID=254247 RepID=A0A5E4PIJ2_9COXI|nr:ABC transporter substrate-binding protein [Aquicella siphonis]VVC76116.1 putative phospholipid-binding protein MlaC [Aquicella siphonis]